MIGNFVDTLRYSFTDASTDGNSHIMMIRTDFGNVRILDTKSDKPVLITAPDGPNVIEHLDNLIAKLSDKYRIISFEFPGNGLSYPNSKYDYSISNGANLIVNLMDILKIQSATLFFSCSNGFYAIKSAELFPKRISQLILSQTPSFSAMKNWTKAIPKPLKYPVIGQIINSFSEKKLAKRWYEQALPKKTDKTKYQVKALNSLNKGGCFCLSALVQGLSRDSGAQLKVTDVPSTLIWGNKDHSHRKTDSNSITEHLPNCEIIEFSDCGHFPELEDTDRFVKILSE